MSKSHEELFSKLSLRNLDPATDIDDFMVWASDEEIAKNCSWDVCKSKEEAIDYINNKIVNHPYFKVICLDNRAIGYVVVTFKEGNDKCRAELGYVLGAGYWGRGIATWAVKKVVSTIFEERPELERLDAFVEVDNVGSQKVMGKAGFVKEGVLRKHYIMKGRTRDFIIFSFLRIDVP